MEVKEEMEGRKEREEKDNTLQNNDYVKENLNVRKKGLN